MKLLGAVEKQLLSVPKGPKARDSAIGLFGLLIGTLQLSRAVDDPAFSKAILAAGTRVAAMLIDSPPADTQNARVRKLRNTSRSERKEVRSKTAT
jgi:hypothetical protein